MSSRTPSPDRRQRRELPLRELAVTYLPISQLKPQERNPRTHSRRQIGQVAESIKVFGFTNPVPLDAENRVVAGHGRVEAARRLGMSEVPTIRLDGMTEAEKRAYVIADNRLAENAGWDRELLALELQHIAKLDVEFDLTVIGLEIGEIDVLLDGSRGADPKADLVPDIGAGPPVSQRGDLWRLGTHRLACGDARDPQAYARKRMGATTVEVKSSHVPMLYRPREVLDVIRKAANAVQQKSQAA